MFSCIFKAFGSYILKVPHIEMFTSDQIVLGDAINDIKRDWACQEHGTCFISGKGDHIEMNWFCLDAWGRAIVCTVGITL
jgi:hypothetical protein